jgi:hypothetical protein
MKLPLHTLGWVASATGLLVAFGAVVTQYEHRPSTPQLVPVSEVQNAQKAADDRHALTEAKLNTQLQATASQLTTTDAKLKALCTKYRLSAATECK